VGNLDTKKHTVTVKNIPGELGAYFGEFCGLVILYDYSPDSVFFLSQLSRGLIVCRRPRAHHTVYVFARARRGAGEMEVWSRSNSAANAQRFGVVFHSSFSAFSLACFSRVLSEIS
jgi:hypothetical protein